MNGQTQCAEDVHYTVANSPHFPFLKAHLSLTPCVWEQLDAEWGRIGFKKSET